ncbi:hypothetical protein GVV04_02775 [Micromonospora sp. NEAU-HG-1]|nr:hypothetical protein [Micromonospora rubida]
MVAPRHARQASRPSAPSARRPTRRPFGLPARRLTAAAPVTRRSGSSICGEHPAHGGSKHLKRAFFLAAFAAPSAALRRPQTRPGQPRPMNRDSWTVIVHCRRKLSKIRGRYRTRQGRGGVRREVVVRRRGTSIDAGPGRREGKR